MLAQVGRVEDGLALLRLSLSLLPEHLAAALPDLGSLDRVTDYWPEPPRQYLLVDLFERARFQSDGCPYAEALNAARIESGVEGG